MGRGRARDPGGARARVPLPLDAPERPAAAAAARARRLDGRQRRASRPRPTRRRDVVPSSSSRGRPACARPTRAKASVHLVLPRSFNDAQQIADKFKDSVPVILNLQSADNELSKRLIDFASGLTYALNGSMQRVADKVFLLTPRNVEVSAEERARMLDKGGFFNQACSAGSPKRRRRPDHPQGTADRARKPGCGLCRHCSPARRHRASSVQRFVSVFFDVYILLILAYVLTSWIRMPYALHRVQRFLDDVCEPYIRIFRRVLPSVGPARPVTDRRSHHARHRPAPAGRADRAPALEKKGVVMALTPVEIRHIQLKRGLFGYRKASVHRMMDDIADSFETVWRERSQLVERVEELETEVTRHVELEGLLRSTLVSAERASQDLKESRPPRGRRDRDRGERRGAQAHARRDHREGAADGRRAPRPGAAPLGARRRRRGTGRVQPRTPDDRSAGRGSRGRPRAGRSRPRTLANRPGRAAAGRRRTSQRRSGSSPGSRASILGAWSPAPSVSTSASRPAPAALPSSGATATPGSCASQRPRSGTRERLGRRACSRPRSSSAAPTCASSAARSSRDKVVEIVGLTLEEAEQRLASAQKGTS